MKEQIKNPEKELSNEEIANLSDADTTLVIRMLTELIELSHKMKVEKKAIQSEIKENIQGTNNEGREKEREKNINVWLPLTHPLLGAWPRTQACALTGN